MEAIAENVTFSWDSCSLEKTQLTNYSQYIFDVATYEEAFQAIHYGTGCSILRQQLLFYQFLKVILWGI